MILARSLKVAWQLPLVIFVKDSSIWHCWQNRMMSLLVILSRSTLQDSCRPAAPSMGLSHDGAEVVDPLIVKQVDLIQGGVALVCCELSCDLFCQATDCLEECFDQGCHYGSWICHSASSAYHGQLTWSTNWSGFRSVCRVIFHELRCPFGSVWDIKTQSTDTQRIMRVVGQANDKQAYCCNPSSLLPPPVYPGHHITF